MTLPILLSVFLIPSISVPFVYLVGKKSPRMAAVFIAIIALVNMALVLSTVPAVLNNASHQYVESYTWIATPNISFTLFTDGISASIALVSLVLILAAALFSINYMSGKKNLAVYYALLAMLSVGLVGVFITSNLILFYLCWELMLVPAYFIVGEWGYKDSYKQAFKLFIYTHAGAVFVLLGIGAIYIFTGSADMFTASALLVKNFAGTSLVQWVLIALTAGFAVKMAVIPVHLWLPDAHAEAPAPMSALLSGVIISAGAYAILRLSLGVVLPSVGITFGINFLHALSIIGILSAFFGSFIALVSTDIKRLIAYSSIAHMGYIMFGLSLYPQSVLGATTVIIISIAITGTVMHIISHALSKGLLFLTAGGVMHQTEKRDITKMGGLAAKMPFTAVASTIAALSIGGAPPFACFISEFLIFVGAFDVMRTDSFYVWPTALMLVATVLSLAYMLRFMSFVFLGTSKSDKEAEAAEAEAKDEALGLEEHHGFEVPNYMKLSFVILVVLVILVESTQRSS